MVFFSGRETGLRRGRGVGFVLTKEVIGYNLINDRVMAMRLKGQTFSITLIQIYASTCDASDEEMEEFYDTVQKIIDTTPKRDIMLLMGDWNAKVGKMTQSSCWSVWVRIKK